MEETSFKNNIKVLETIANVILGVFILSAVIMVIIAFSDATWDLLIIVLIVLLYGLLIYYFLLVFCGIAKNLLTIKYELSRVNKVNNSNGQELSSGVKAAKEYLARAKKDHQLKMRIQKCINTDEFLQVARSEGYIFTEDDLNEAKEWQKDFEE